MAGTAPKRVRLESLAAGLGVDRLARLEHGDEFLQPPRAGPRPPGVLQPVEDGVAVLARELPEEGLRLRSGIELAAQVRRDRDAPLTLIRSLPAAVVPGALDLGEPRGLHPVLGDQPLGRVAVYPRPPATTAPRREPLQETTIVERLATSVAPPEAEGALEHLGIADALETALALGDLDPHAVRVGVVVLEPRLPLGGGGEGDPRKTVVGSHAYLISESSRVEVIVSRSVCSASCLGRQL